jgi:5-formyltetrahydrofolate cyclo-ligase
LGKAVSVPKISWQQRRMMAVEINSLETGFSTSASGLRNPVMGVPVPFEEINLVVTPALGFDRKGNRLGRGGSYYDRFFTDEKFKASKCGFAFTEQVVDSIPVISGDVPVDFLVTDEEIMYFNDQEGE